MPVSFEGLTFSRHLFKPVANNESAGCYADVYLPATEIGSGAPIALSIHGGGFTTGDTHHIFQGHFAYLLNRGFCVVSVEYRLAPHYHFRDMREDWLDAYRWIKTDLEHVVKGLDPSRVFVFGGSAGGTASLFLALDAHVAGLPPPSAVYVIYPAVDFDAVSAHFRKPVDYGAFDTILATLAADQQKLLKDFVAGPSATAYDCKNEHLHPITGRRVWYDLAMIHPFLISCFLDEAGPPYSKTTSFVEMVTPNFPPTVLVKALADTLVDPRQTQLVYDKLQALGVESRLIEAEGMLHGDAEGENDIKDHPPREAAFWSGVYDVALDWCITRTEGEAKRSAFPQAVAMETGPYESVAVEV